MKLAGRNPPLLLPYPTPTVTRVLTVLSHVFPSPSHASSVRMRTHPPNLFPYYKAGGSHIAISAIADHSQATKMGGDASLDAPKLRTEFLRFLRRRRSAEEVQLQVESAKPVEHPLYQGAFPPTYSEAMDSCPKANISNLKELLREENLYLTTEAGEQGRLPILIKSLKDSKIQRRPAVIFLHSTQKCKEWLKPLLEGYASKGYIAIAIDSRYHGERATSKTTYHDALISSWKRGDTMPFIFDTVWDLIKLADYLTQREDIDPSRIGITGESLGGMHAWFAAAADTRYSVVVPIIGVQGFRWAIDHDKWQARVNSIKPVFEEARNDLGKSVIDKEVVEKVWDRIAPGLASEFDAPYSVPAISPRPLLILNGAEDPRCPVAGLDDPISRAQQVYGEAQCPDNFKVVRFPVVSSILSSFHGSFVHDKPLRIITYTAPHNMQFIAQPGIGHQMTSEMVKEASDWFDRFFMQ